MEGALNVSSYWKLYVAMERLKRIHIFAALLNHGSMDATAGLVMRLHDWAAAIGLPYHRTMRYQSARSTP